ncbi:MAG: M23 family metallopeptidase [Spirochaetes bacterium]|jgi:murein DD-endopeptidase MepM/ murein hydrolase activator NlpD|nr:M23 family metallopeptidase [Spirochaetota bacterium]
MLYAFKRRIVEKRHVLRRKISKKWSSFLEHGHEKMTIMFIPHDEKKIFNFQISKFTVLFFLVLFATVVTTSSFAYMKNNQIKSEEEQLIENYREIHNQLKNYESMTNEVSKLMGEIRPEIEDLYEMAAGSEDISEIWQMVQNSETGSDEDLATLKKVLPGEVFELKRLQGDILCATNTVKTVRNFVDVRSQVINDTPSIIPNRGHITSLFGWRRSPFGTGRDFHTGIDIAAPEGTPIRATAPGKVIMVGWGGGYGKMVRIQHKYGFKTFYAHQSTTITKVDDYVKKGQVIGYVGHTGASTGNHLHYEVRLGNVPINPYPYMSRMW